MHINYLFFYCVFVVVGFMFVYLCMHSNKYVHQHALAAHRSECLCVCGWACFWEILRAYTPRTVYMHRHTSISQYKKIYIWILILLLFIIRINIYVQIHLSATNFQPVYIGCSRQNNAKSHVELIHTTPACTQTHTDAVAHLIAICNHQLCIHYDNANLFLFQFLVGMQFIWLNIRYMTVFFFIKQN